MADGRKELTKILSIRAISTINPKNKYKKRGDGIVTEEFIVEYFREHKVVSIKEIAVVLFDGDYTKARNMLRGPVAQGRLRKTKSRGIYEYVEVW